MTKVITYGTYDLLHYGHIRLLERAKALGDWLIVGVTSDDFDKSRGKINVQQPLMERIEALRQTGIPDEIIVEQNQCSARGTHVPTAIYRYKNVVAGYTHWYWAEHPSTFGYILSPSK